MKEIRCNNQRDNFAPHFIGELDDQGLLHVYTSVWWTKDFVTGQWLWAMRGRSKRERPWKPADARAKVSTATMAEAELKLEAILAGREPGARGTYTLGGARFIGTLTDRGTVDVTWDDPPDRLRGSDYLLETPCLVRCWCKSIITVSKS